MFKKIAFAVIATSVMTACNNEAGQHEHHTGMEPKTHEDSLYKDVMDGHNVVMPKMGKVKGFIALAQQQLDSLSKLPEKAQLAAAVYKASLDSLIGELKNADRSMTVWMDEFVPDSLEDETEKRVAYLESEKIKVEQVKSNILGSLEKAEKILGRKE